MMLADLGFTGNERGAKAQEMTASLLKGGADLELSLSPVFPVTVDRETRKLAGIPLNATTFCYCYSPDVDQDAVRRLRMVHTVLVQTTEFTFSVWPAPASARARAHVCVYFL